MSRQTFITPPSQNVAGNANGLAPGSVIVGPVLKTMRCKVGTIAASVTALAQTTSLTFTPSWQVGNKADMSDAQVIETGEIGAVHAVEATGTAGVDVAITRAIPAPSAVSGFLYCRLVLTTGGATGGAADAYSISMHWSEPDALDLISGRV